MQLTKFQPLPIIYAKRKNLSVAYMLGHSFTQKELQLKYPKHKQLPPQIAFETLHMIIKLNLYTYWLNVKTYVLHKRTIVFLFWLILGINSAFGGMTKGKRS